MNKLYENSLYLEDLRSICNEELPWDRLRGRMILLSGATGMIGSFLVDVLMRKNLDGLGCKIYALTRDVGRARERFSFWHDAKELQLIAQDLNVPMQLRTDEKVDYVMHLASNTHPMQYAKDPIGTITANILGLHYLLDFAAAHGTERFVFASSNEIYGENRGDAEMFREDYCGYLNSNTLRACYPESKRCGEALCQAYRAQKGLDIVIPRFTRSYGPTMLLTDTKAISQFVLNGARGEDIVLKSEGMQYYSYTYVADAVNGLLRILLRGADGEAYNIADEKSDMRLKDLAALIAEKSGQKVIFQLPDAVEASGYSTATKARLDGSKLKSLGWEPRFSMEGGIERTIRMLRDAVI